MTDDDLNRLCAQAMVLLETGTWWRRPVDDGEIPYWGDREVWGEQTHKDGSIEDIHLLDCLDGDDIAHLTSAYIVAAQPSAIIAMVRRIRELEYEVAKTAYREACRNKADAYERYGHEERPVLQAEVDCATAKAAVDDAAARLTAVGGRS